MNKEILIQENKKLILKNVVCKELLGLSYYDLDKEIQKFQSTIMAKNLHVYGPLIIKNFGTHLQDDGVVTVDVAILTQAKDYMIMKDSMIVEDEHVCSNCVYTHFDGRQEDIQMAYNKADIYIYENNLDTTGVVYTLYLSRDTNNAVIDIFKQVVLL